MKDTVPGLGISAVIPTRGDVDITPIIKRVEPFVDEIIVADYGLSVYNRYKGIKKAKNDIIYTQDDDCLVDVEKIITLYEPGIIVNAIKPDRIKDYPDMTLVGWGAVFDKDLTKVLDDWEKDELFMRECDRVFTALNKRHSIPMPVQDLYQGNRMGEEDRHWNDLKKIRERIYVSGLGV